MKTLPLFAAALVMATSMAASSEPPAIKSFYIEVAQANLAEIELGMLAKEKGSTPAIRMFAQHMIQDHADANVQLAMAARRNGIALPMQPNAEQQSTHMRLQSLSGTDFDEAYLDTQVADHGSMVARLEAQADAAVDASTRNYIAGALPIVKQHETMAKRMTHAVPQQQSLYPSHYPSQYPSRFMYTDRVL